MDDHKRKRGAVNAKKARRARMVFRAEREKDELVTKANDRFLRSGAQIRDVYAKLAE